MTPKDIIEKIPGLTRDQLTYYVRMGYVKPRKYTRGKNEYTDFSETDFIVIEEAFGYIERFGTKPKFAFEKAHAGRLQSELKFK